MSTLRQCSDRLRELLAQLDQTAQSHTTAKLMVSELENNPTASLQGVGLHLRFATGGDIPVPLPTDRERLLDLLHDSANFLGQEAIRVWGEIKQIADTANQICAQAVTAHQQGGDGGSQGAPGS